MQYREDARTGNRLSVLGFGCMRLPRGISGIDLKRTEALMTKAMDEGVNYFDTAYLYPGAEAALGEVLSRNNARSRVHIATKLPIASCRKESDFDRIFSIQQKRLRTDFVDYYLIHNINHIAQWEALLALGIEKWLERQKKESMRAIGFSFHGTRAEFSKLLAAYDWDFCQIQLNYANEDHQAGVSGLMEAGRRGIPVIVMEPLLGGKLANDLPKQAVDLFKHKVPEKSPAAWGLSWLLDKPEVTVILSGMNREEQLSDNLKTADASFPGMLTPEEKDVYKQVLKIFEQSYKVHCTGCGYCMPCPHHVDIPGCFAAYNTSFAHGRFAGITQYVIGTAASRRQRGSADQCVACGACEKHCPQTIPIIESLRLVRRRVEPIHVRAAMHIMRALHPAREKK